MRKIEIESSELKELLQQHNESLVKVREVLAEGEELEKKLEEVKKKYKKLEAPHLKISEKIKPIAVQVTKGLAEGEFEYVKDVVLEEGKMYAVIEDALENWKQAYREKTKTIKEAKAPIEK